MKVETQIQPAPEPQTPQLQNQGFSAGTKKLLGIGVFTGAATISWCTQSTAKLAEFNKQHGYSQPYDIFNKYRWVDALAGILGYDLVKRMFPEWQGSPENKTFKPNPFGWLNKTTIGAGVGYAVNQMLKENVPEYRKLDMIPELIDALLAGVTVGSAIGGVFDPEPPAGGSSKTVDMQQAPASRVWYVAGMN